MGPFNKYKFEIGIAITALFCWGRLIGLEGMWQDDWAWTWHYFGSSSSSEFLEPFRNMGHLIVGYIDYAFLMMLDTVSGKAPAVWHTIMFLVHTLNALVLYHIVRIISNNENLLPAFCMSALYLFSPAINNLYLMVQVSYEILILSYLLSLMFTLLAIKGDRFRPLYYLFSVSLAAVSMSGLESFIAVEFSRPFLICYLLTEGKKENLTPRFKKIFLYSAPFLAVALIFIIKRLTFVPAGGYTGYNKLQIFSLEGMVETLRLLFLSLKHLFIKSWKVGIKRVNDLSVISIFFVLAAMGAYAALFIIRKSKVFIASAADSVNKKNLKFLALYGIAILLLGILPYNVVGKYPVYGLESRHVLIAKLGYPIFALSLFFLAGLWSIRIKKALPFIFGVLLFAGLVSSHATIDQARQNWKDQRSIWWQFIWRAPDIKPNTFMIIDMPWPESPGGGSYVLPPAMNLAYAKSRDKTEIFSHYAYELRNAFRTDETNYRAIYNKEIVEFQTFKGLTSFYPKNLIAASYQNGYLYINDEIAEPVSSDWSDVEFMLSNVSEDRIIYKDTGAEFPYRWILGPEPDHDWRYYYQRANALSGRNDPEGVVDLYNEARKAGYDLDTILPQNLMPFIKAFYLTDKSDKADDLFGKWALSPSGSTARARRFLGSEEIKNDPGLNDEISRRTEALFGDRNER